MSDRARQGRKRSTSYPAPGRVPRVREQVPIRALLDTHAFLWWIGDDPRLPKTARKVIAAGDSELLISAASAWEIAIKAGLGRLDLPKDLGSFLTEQLQINRITPLPVSVDHAVFVTRLPDHHRDPFDRLLVAQSLLEDLPVVTGDRHVAQYGVEVIW